MLLWRAQMSWETNKLQLLWQQEWESQISMGGGGARLLEGVEKQQKYHVWVTGTENRAVSR